MCCAAVAIARTLPLYHSKSKSKKEESENEQNATTTASGVNVSFYNDKGEAITNDSLWQTSRAVAEGVRLSARLGDMPPAELNPDTYAQECKAVAESLVSNSGANVTFREIVGEELKDGGYGGIYGVGMAAQCPPRMVVMTYTPEEDDGGCCAVEHVVLCGKVCGYWYEGAMVGMIQCWNAPLFDFGLTHVIRFFSSFPRLGCDL